MDFKYIVQSAGLLDKVSLETVVNPTWSAGSDKGRLVTKCTKPFSSVTNLKIESGIILLKSRV